MPPLAEYFRLRLQLSHKILQECFWELLEACHSSPSAANKVAASPMDNPDNFGTQDTVIPDSMRDLARRLDEAWQRVHVPGESVDLADFLPVPGDPSRLATLHFLIEIDLEARWSRGQPTSLEHYLEHFGTELVSPDALPSRLLYAEYRIRNLYGDKPSLQAYQARFPGQFDELKALAQEQPFTTMMRPTKQVPSSPPFVPPVAAPPALLPEAPRSEKRFAGGNYRLLNRLGRGSFGEVWRAEAPGGVEVAVKIIISPLEESAAQRELRALDLIRRLRHPYLLQTHQYHRHEDRLWIVMELADCSLRDRARICRQDGMTGIPVEELRTYFQEAAEALDFLHSQSVQHRDIKPDNLLLVQKHIKVADFGLARAVESEQLNVTRGAGTPAFMAPEVWHGHFSPHSDQYSLAVTYVELRRGRPLFASANIVEAMEDHIKNVPDLSPLPRTEQDVLFRALAKDPEQRFPSCQAFVSELVTATRKPRVTETVDWKEPVPALSRDNDTEPLESRLAPTPSPWGRRAFIGVSVGLLAGMALVTWNALHTSPPPPPDHSGDLPSLPFDNCKPAKDARTTDRAGKSWYDRITLVKEGVEIPFLLIPRQQERDPPTFYIMETKVWVDAFRPFASAIPKPTTSDEWEKGGEVSMASTMNRNGRHPVLRVAVEDAYRYSRWLGGQLPTRKQWDKASGFNEPTHGRGPFRDPPDVQVMDWIAVNSRRTEPGPMPVGSAPGDISLLGCKDMAGNGFEWTRDLSLDGVEFEVPLLKPARPTIDLVWMRGQSYLAPEPYLFADRDLESLDYLKCLPTIGFRVVLEPP